MKWFNMTNKEIINKLIETAENNFNYNHFIEYADYDYLSIIKELITAFENELEEE